MSASANMIRIKMNGDSMELPIGCSIGQLLEIVEVRSRLVAVEVNSQIVPKSEHHYQLQSGDVVEIVTLVGGG